MVLFWIFVAVAAFAGQGFAQAHAQTVSSTLTLRSALQRALASNPRLTAAERDVGIATGRRIQAGAIPNPEFLVGLENVLGSGPYRGLRSAETTLQISQLLELGGKREARIAAGIAAVDSAAWERQAVRLEVLSETAIAYINVLSAQRRIQILEQHIAAIDRLTPLLQRRVDAGASSPAEVLRARVAADLMKVERERSKAALATARRDLAILMGDGNAVVGNTVGDLESTRRPPPLRTVLDAIENNPQLVRWTAVRAQRDAELLSARLKPIPNLRASVGWKNFQDTKDNAAVFGVSAVVPLWDQNRGDILAARESLDKVPANRAINKAALIAAAGRAYDATLGALNELDLLRTSVLPNVRSAAQAMEDGYAQGRFTLLELLDVQSAAMEALLREMEALRTFHIAVATIEGLVGRPFSLAGGARR
jgi:cobalt-zinc-cadmium efflux system outer membrane protein